MSEIEEGMPGAVDGTVLQDQVTECDNIIRKIARSNRERKETVTDEDPVEQAYGLYKQIRKYSVAAFEERFQTSALYDALKAFLRKIGVECGYEQQLWYTRHGRQKAADAIDNSLNWFKLYAAVVLEEQPELTYEWSVTHFKEHREDFVSHAPEIPPLRDVPEPTLVSSVVPLWYTLEDTLLLWRSIHDMDEDRREFRQKVLSGEEFPDNQENQYRYGFVQELMHNTEEDDHDTDAGFITDYGYGEDGDRVLFTVHQVEFFPSIGDVVQYQVSEKRSNKVAETVTLFE